MIRSEHSVQYQYRNHTYAFKADIASGRIAHVVLDDVCDVNNYSVATVSKEHLDHVTEFVRSEWEAKPIDEFTEARFTTRVVPDEGVLYKGDGYYVQRPGSPEQMMGPYDSRAMARNMARGYALAIQYGTKFPEPTMRFAHKNGNEYTVIGVSNLHSDRDEYIQRVFYQGDNGRTWDKTLPEFMRKMKLIATHEIKPVMQAKKVYSAPFTDSEGTLCEVQEGQFPGTLYLGARDVVVNKLTGEPMPSRMALDIKRAQALLPYLIHFVQTGNMPENELPPVTFAMAEYHGN